MRASTRIGVVVAAVIGGATPTTEASTLTATFTTTANGGTYAPKNVVAVWVEGPGGTFVKTIGRWAAVRQNNLVAWIGKAGANDVDAVSGATRPDHATPLMITWDLKNKAGTEVPDGTYTVRMELADTNTASAANNHEGTFTFIKGTTAQDQTGLTNGGFTNVSLHFTPGATQPPPTNPPPTNPPPSGGGGGGGDAGLDNTSDGAITGGCTTSHGGAGLALIGLAGVLAARRRRR